MTRKVRSGKGSKKRYGQNGSTSFAEACTAVCAVCVCVCVSVCACERVCVCQCVQNELGSQSVPTTLAYPHNYQIIDVGYASVPHKHNARHTHGTHTTQLKHYTHTQTQSHTYPHSMQFQDSEPMGLNW